MARPVTDDFHILRVPLIHVQYHGHGFRVCVLVKSIVTYGTFE